jgi:hypothetical protein
LNVVTNHLFADNFIDGFFVGREITSGVVVTFVGGHLEIEANEVTRSQDKGIPGREDSGES